MKISKIWKVGPYNSRASFQVPVAEPASAADPKVK